MPSTSRISKVSSTFSVFVNWHIHPWYRISGFVLDSVFWSSFFLTQFSSEATAFVIFKDTLYQDGTESYFSSDLNLGSTWLPIIPVACHLVHTDGNYCCFCCVWMVQTENPVSLCLLWRKHKEIILVSKDSAPNNTVHGKLASFLLARPRLCGGNKRSISMPALK